MRRHVLETDEGLKYFAPAREAAWLGLLHAHAALTRALDQGMSVNHGLTLSSYEVLSRLAHAPDGYLRMTELTEQTQLSLSRVSRVVDQLESADWSTATPASRTRVSCTQASASPGAS